MLWDINSHELVPYDILPYFRREYDSSDNKPITKQEWIEFIERWGHYNYWSRCEYEFMVSSWPPFFNKDGNLKQIKVDVWDQLKMNIDIIADILMTEKSQ